MQGPCRYKKYGVSNLEAQYPIATAHLRMEAPIGGDLYTRRAVTQITRKEEAMLSSSSSSDDEDDAIFGSDRREERRQARLAATSKKTKKKTRA